MLPRTRRGIWLRNLSLRTMMRWPVRNLVAGMSHNADALVLDDYVTSGLPAAGDVPAD